MISEIARNVKRYMATRYCPLVAASCFDAASDFGREMCATVMVTNGCLQCNTSTSVSPPTAEEE